MEALPTINSAIAPSCALDADGMRRQAERYRRAGAGATLLARTPRRLALRVRPEAQAEVTEAVAIERECCPFYEIDWDPSTGELSFAVGRAEDEPALEAIAAAFGLRQ